MAVHPASVCPPDVGGQWPLTIRYGRWWLSIILWACSVSLSGKINCSISNEENRVIASQSARWRGNPYSLSYRIRYQSVRRGTDCHVGLRPPRNDIRNQKCSPLVKQLRRAYVMTTPITLVICLASVQRELSGCCPTEHHSSSIPGSEGTPPPTRLFFPKGLDFSGDLSYNTVVN